MITDVAFVVYPVTDIVRSRAFYEQTLGLKTAEIFGPSWIEYQVGAATFVITDNFGFSAPSSSVAFEVDDLDSQVATLRAAGVSFQGDINQFPSCRMALITDPDGSTICLHQKNT